MNRADSLRMLDARSEYDKADGPDLSLQEGGIDGFKTSPIPTRSRARVAAVRIHPGEMPSRDYFWGAWVSMIVEKDGWILTKPKRMPHAPFVQDADNREPGTGPKSSGPARPKGKATGKAS